MYLIYSIETKKEDWKVASIINSAGDKIDNVSINRVSRKGDIFPNFDTLAAKQKIDARLWENPDNGKMYLFAPKGGAKAPMKQTTDQSSMSNASNNEAEYPISVKLETLLNKFTGMQIDIQIIKELLQSKKKPVVDDFPPYEYEGEPYV